MSRPDLADRGLFLMLYPIAEEQRRAQSELLVEIEAARPGILGALLSAVVHGLQKLPETRLDRLPRMADFALWATACEGGVGWEAGTFMDAYDSNRRTAIADVIDSDPVAAAVRDLMDNPATPRNLVGRTEWTGTAKSLLAALQLQVGDAVAKGKTWPKSPRGLSGRLRRAATFLRASGTEITFGKREGHDRDRTITITGPENSANQPSASSAPSVQRSPARIPDAYAPLDVDGAAAPIVRGTLDRPQSVRSNSLKRNAADGADGADEKKPAPSDARALIVPPADQVVL